MGPRQATEAVLRAYATKGKLAAVSAPTARQLAIFNARAWNRSGSTLNVGILRKLAAYLTGYGLYTYLASGPTVTVVSAAALAAGQVVATVTNNDGFIVQGKRRFGFVGFTVSNTAANGTYAFKYWDGTTWQSLTTIENPTNLASTGDKFIAFLSPVDWAAGGPTGVDSTMYSILVQHTTAPDDTGAINALWVAEMLEYYEGVADNVGVQVSFDAERPFMLDALEGLMPYFSTANAANAFGSFYSTV
jgi:hypothetical protein